MPRGGFGNLIALPLQKESREWGNSVFLDDGFTPWVDQWAFLASVRQIGRAQVEGIVREAEQRGRILGVRLPVQAEREDEPWTLPASRRRKEPPLAGAFARTSPGHWRPTPRASTGRAARPKPSCTAAWRPCRNPRGASGSMPCCCKKTAISCCAFLPRTWARSWTGCSTPFLERSLGGPDPGHPAAQADSELPG